MSAGRYDFTIEQGADFTRVLTWNDASGKPIDLTGYTAKMQLKERDGTVALELSTADGKITLGGAQGTITLTATNADTAALPAGDRLRYDLILTDATGKVTRLLEGTVGVSPRVTV